MSEKVHVLHGEECDKVMQWLSQEQMTFTIDQVQSKEIHKASPPPYITSSLQQDGSRKLGLSPSRTMALAQTLYERGYITYMRTDSPTLSSNAKQASIAMITELYGNAYLPSDKDGPIGNKGKTPKNAQEAHEAIRPAEIEGRFRLPETLSSELAPEELRLYDMIFRRTLASQMASSLSLSATVTILAGSTENKQEPWQEAAFRCSETSIVFPGYLRALSSRYSSGEAENNLLHSLSKGQKLSLSKDSTWTKSTTVGSSLPETVGEAGEVEEVVEGGTSAGTEALVVEDEAEEGAVSLSMPGLRSVSHDTRPPSRFTEASFIRELEKIGVGRPSTYSYILSVLRERDYVLVDKQSLIPTVRGLLVASFLEEHFSSFVSEAFTAQMEELLDGVAKGEVEKATFLQSFYFGDKKNMTESNDDQGDEEVKKKKGLLTAVVELLEDEKMDRRETRCLTLSHLSDLGKLRLSRNGVLFEKNPTGDAAITTTPTTSASSSSSSASDSTDEASDLVWKLPLEMERDLREITREKIIEILTSQPSLQGRSLGIHPETNETISLRSGRFGKYLELRESLSTEDSPSTTKSGRQKKAAVRTMSVPSWLTEDTSIEDVLELMALPKILGTHPENDKETISLELFSGALCVVVRGEESLSQASIVTPISLTNFTIQDALRIIQDAQRNTDTKEGKGLLRKQVISTSDLRELGEWEGKKVSIQLGRFGLYLRSGNIVAGLGKFDAKSITLEDAITILTRKQARKAKMSSASKAKKTTTAKSKSPAAGAATVLKAKKAASTTKKTKAAVKSTTGATKTTTRRKKATTATMSEDEATASLTLNEDVQEEEEEGKVVVGRKKSKVGVRRSTKKSESLDSEEPSVISESVEATEDDEGVKVKKTRRTKASTAKTTKTKVTRRRSSKKTLIEVDGEHGVEQKEEEEEEELPSDGKRRRTKASTTTTSPSS